MLRQKDISWQDIVVFGGRKVELMVARLLKPLSSLFASSSSSLICISTCHLCLYYSGHLCLYFSGHLCLYYSGLLCPYHPCHLCFYHPCHFFHDTIKLRHCIKSRLNNVTSILRRKISLRWTANWRQNEEGWSHSLLLPFGHRLQVCWYTNILILIDSMLTPIY